MQGPQNHSAMVAVAEEADAPVSYRAASALPYRIAARCTPAASETLHAVQLVSDTRNATRSKALVCHRAISTIQDPARTIQRSMQTWQHEGGSCWHPQAGHERVTPGGSRHRPLTYLEVPVDIENAGDRQGGWANSGVWGPGHRGGPAKGGSWAADGRRLAAAAHRRLAAEEGAPGRACPGWAFRATCSAPDRYRQRRADMVRYFQASPGILATTALL